MSERWRIETAMAWSTLCRAPGAGIDPLAVLQDFAEAQYRAGVGTGGTLARFGARVLEVFREGRHGDLDGWEVQEWAEAAGVLEPRVVTEPCGDDCDCEPGDTCYWLTESAQRALAALRGEPPTPEGA